MSSVEDHNIIIITMSKNSFVYTLFDPEAVVYTISSRRPTRNEVVGGPSLSSPHHKPFESSRTVGKSLC